MKRKNLRMEVWSGAAAERKRTSESESEDQVG